MHVLKDFDNWNFILEARIERERTYTCLRMLQWFLQKLLFFQTKARIWKMKSENVPIMADDLSGSVPRHVKESGTRIQDWKIWLLGIWHNKSLLECGERILELPWHPWQVWMSVTACVWCLWCSLWCCCKWSPWRAIGSVNRCPDVTMVSRCTLTTIPRPDDDHHQDYCVQKLWRTHEFIWSSSLNSRLMNRLQAYAPQ